MCFVEQFPVIMFTTVRHSAVLPPSQPGPYPAPDCLQLQLDLINCHLPMWHCNAGCKTKLMMISIVTYLCVLLIQKSIRVYLKFVYILYYIIHDELVVIIIISRYCTHALCAKGIKKSRSVFLMEVYIYQL